MASTWTHNGRASPTALRQFHGADCFRRRSDVSQDQGVGGQACGAAHGEIPNPAYGRSNASAGGGHPRWPDEFEMYAGLPVVMALGYLLLIV